MNAIYRPISIEDFVSKRLDIAPQSVWAQESIEDHTMPGHVAVRMVQVLSVTIAPHAANGFDYEWRFFDFETKTVHTRFCWGCSPALFALDEGEEDAS